MSSFLQMLVFTIVPVSCLVAGTETITVVGGGIGNGDFEVTALEAGPAPYSATANWFNASGSEDIEFTTDSETTGSSDPNSRACIPFHNRLQVNNSGYEVTQAGDVFSVSFDFGRTGGNWDGDESYRVFLFTSTEAVDELISDEDINELASVEYQVPTSGVWENEIQFNAFFVTAPENVGQTIFIGMVLENPVGAEVFPRLDEMKLVVDEDVIAGDVDGDGSVSLLDVNPFVALVTSGIYQVEADINIDGSVDLLDVAPFVNKLVRN